MNEATLSLPPFPSLLYLYARLFIRPLPPSFLFLLSLPTPHLLHPSSSPLLFPLQDLYIDNDTSPLFRVAKAICKLEAIYGIIPRVYGKGKNAQVIGFCQHQQP